MSAALPLAVVEDDPGFSRAVVRYLRATGYEVSAFPSAEEFLAAQTAAFGCLILDLQLPGISGFELFKQISTSVPHRLAIFISAQDEGEIRTELSRFPGCVFLHKPFAADDLLAAVRAQIDRFRNAIDTLS